MGDDPLIRLERVERQVARLESELELLRHPRSATWSAPKQAPPWPAPTPVPRPSPVPVREPVPIDSEVILKWGGVGLVVLAVGFAVSTAISRGWIGPELQLIGAAAVALGLVGTGLRLRATRPRWTHPLCAAGIAAAYVTVASNLFLDEASDTIAFAATAAIGVAGYVLARFVPSEWIGSVALVGGITGWLVIARSDPAVFASLVWFGVAVAAAVVLSVEQRWYALRLLGVVAGLLVVLRLAAEAQSPAEQVAVLVAGAVLGASLVHVPSIGDMASVWQQLEIQLVIALAPWAFGVTVIALGLEGDVEIGWTAIAAAVAVVLLATIVRRRIEPAHLVSLVVSASLALSIGVAVLLETTAVFVGLAVQGVGLVVLSRLFGGNIRVLVNAALVLIVATAYALVAMVDAWDVDVRLIDDAAHLMIVVAVAVAAWQTQRREVERVAALGVLAMVLIWLGSVLVHLPQGQAVVSVAWAVVGTAVLLTGTLRKVPEIGAVGLAVLALTVGKLLTVDLREVDTLWRAGLFFVVGLGFLRLGFLLPRLTGGTQRADDVRSRSGRARH